MEALQELVGTVRNLRSEYRVDPGTDVRVELRAASPPLREALAEEEAGARRLGGISELVLTPSMSDGDGSEAAERVSADGARGPGAHAVLRSGTEVFLPLAEVIDLDRERERLQAEVERLEELLAGTRGRLRNEDFLTKAPPEVVERERDKERSLEEQRGRLLEKRRALETGG